MYYFLLCDDDNDRLSYNLILLNIWEGIVFLADLAADASLFVVPTYSTLGTYERKM